MADSEIPLAPSQHPIGLYVHIPVCRTKCLYCDFYSETGLAREVIDRMLQETLDQAQFFLARMGNPEIKTVYIGGGTPSCLGGRNLHGFLNALNGLVSGRPLEITVEANPESLVSGETLYSGFLEACGREGVTRISLGIQSFNGKMLATLGRIAGEREIDSALGLIESSWKGRLNIDLMTGIPGQTHEDVEQDISKAIQAKPDHISLYALTIEPGTPLESKVRHGLLRMSSEDFRDDLWIGASRLLVTGGYRNYEISNFAKPGGECLHNLGYWNMEPYLGVGPGAESTLPGKGGTVLRLSNPPHIDTFLEGRQHTWGMKVTPLSRGEFLFENLMMGFRLSKGIRQITFRKRFESDLAQALGGLWSEWTARGLVLKRPGRYALSRRGRMILNRLLLEIQERVPREQWESGRCRWP